ncbi:hypothetical protein RvY_02349 [Ramazzottius varieornatus]|uniref:Uncharacterized protein n=1 Tax=Ramazzottius varieornatus TaxID=947166 RepID=A0A1D1URH2_RAMVA|nr:hypothetical protein RvY_02349 [Ramazzottius varieornatus]
MPAVIFSTVPPLPLPLTAFTTHLAEELRIPESELWEMSLVSIQCPERIATFPEDGNERNVMFRMKDGKRYQKVTPQGYYQDVEALCNALNLLPPAAAQVFKYNALDRTVSRAPNDTVIAVELSPYMKRLLGIEQPFGLREASLTTHTDTVYVYCNLIRSQLVGNTKAQVLAVVSAESVTRGRMCQGSGSFVPIADNSFDKIIVELADSTGRIIPFADGITTVRLRFRKRA